MYKIEEKIIRDIFENMKNEIFPEFGSPETRCNKCMFYEVVCPPRYDRVGCYGGWKREEEVWFNEN